MRRDMKLIALILAHVERAVKCGDIPIPDVPGYTRPVILYHVKLCEEAGYLDIVVDASGKTPVSIHRMTWDGHEALDRLRGEFTDC